MSERAGPAGSEPSTLVQTLEQQLAAGQLESAAQTQALRDSEARLRAILHSAVEGILTIDERGIIESFNPAAEKMFGRTEAEVAGRNVSLLMPEPDRGRHDGYLANYGRTGEAKIIGIGREVLGRRQDGTVFPLDLAVSEVRLGGRRIFAGFVRDLTEAKAAETALRHHAALVESSDDAIIGKTLQGQITSWNHGAEVLFGYSAAEATGQSITLIIPPERRREEDQILERIQRGESVEHFETVRQRKDGSRVEISVTISPIRERGGAIIGASKVARSITERKRLQREILEISEREQRRIGHDLHDGLCQELAGLELMCQALEQKLAARAPEEAGQAGAIAQHVRRAIAHTRKLARGLSPVELQANGLMSALHEFVAGIRERSGLEARLDCPEPVLIRDQAAATHLFRLVQEAVTNTLKHGQARRVTVALQPAAGHCRLTVADDGVGFQPAQAPGPGMGLQIMKYRAAMVGASLEVRSSPGAGVTVTCVFAKNL